MRGRAARPGPTPYITPGYLRVHRDDALVPADERSVRVSTLEMFFDLVFVFTITQLTGVLVDGHGGVAIAQVVVMLLVIWWMYDGYAWLTNAITTDRLRFRLLLIGGMGGFLVIALAIPTAFEARGSRSGWRTWSWCSSTRACTREGTSVSEMAAILRLVPYNLGAAGVVLVGGAVGGDAQWILWTRLRCCCGSRRGSPRPRASSISAPHFVERHGIVIIVALGESIVVIGAGAVGARARARARARRASVARAQRVSLVGLLSRRDGGRAVRWKRQRPSDDRASR